MQTTQKRPEQQNDAPARRTGGPLQFEGHSIPIAFPGHAGPPTGFGPTESFLAGQTLYAAPPAALVGNPYPPSAPWQVPSAPWQAYNPYNAPSAFAPGFQAFAPQVQAPSYGRPLWSPLQAARPAMPAQATGQFTQRVPPIDIVDEGAEYVCQVELPGVKRENVDVSCFERALLVTAHAEPDIDVGALVLAERGTTTSFRRAITLPSDVQTANAKATLSDGILTINLPKTQPTAGPKRIPVA